MRHHRKYFHFFVYLIKAISISAQFYAGFYTAVGVSALCYAEHFCTLLNMQLIMLIVSANQTGLTITWSAVPETD